MHVGISIIIRFVFTFFLLYVIGYTLLEKVLSKRMKETSFLKLMCISHRLTAIMFLYGSAKGIYIIIRILLLLLTSKTPNASDIIDLFLFGFVLILTVCYRKTIWYDLTRKTRTMYADWYIHKFLLIDKNENNIEHAYVYLQKASELKPDSVFIWSTMARIDERFFEKSELATEHLSKAEQILNSSKTLSQNDEAVLEAAKGDVLLCRDHISEGLAHFKNASELDPSSFEKLYETALKWANEDETSKEN